MATDKDYEKAGEIADTFENGNRSDAVAAIAEATPPLAAAVLACTVFELLRGRGGIHHANDFRAAMERRL